MRIFITIVSRRHLPQHKKRMEMMKYRALFLDIDDTLIGTNKNISAVNLEAIHRAQQAGIFVTIATGRSYLGSASILAQLEVHGPVIVYGGAGIVDNLTGEMLFNGSIDKALIRESLAYANKWGVHAQIYQGDMIISAEENEFTKRYSRTLNLPFLVDPLVGEKDWEDVPKVLVYVTPGEAEAEMLSRFIEEFGGRLEIASSKPGFIELNRLGSHKGSALLQVADILGISAAQTVAIGDNTLDYQMIQMAGLGVCVENGQQLVKDIADVVAPSCDDDGVAWVINELMLPNGRNQPI